MKSVPQSLPIRHNLVQLLHHRHVDGAEVALSYALLGGFAALISYSGITDYLVNKIINSIHAENSKMSRVKVKGFQEYSYLQPARLLMH